VSHLEQPSSGRPRSPPKNPGKSEPNKSKINRSGSATAPTSASTGGVPSALAPASHAKFSGWRGEVPGKENPEASGTWEETGSLCGGGHLLAAAPVITGGEGDAAIGQGGEAKRAPSVADLGETRVRRSVLVTGKPTGSESSCPVRPDPVRAPCRFTSTRRHLAKRQLHRAGQRGKRGGERRGLCCQRWRRRLEGRGRRRAGWRSCW
jgi:hypothetical protein